MKRIIFAGLLACGLALPQPARSDTFGGDVLVLTQILTNAVQQLYQLMQVVRAGQDSLALMRDINKGINDSMAMVQTLRENPKAGLYSDWGQAEDALKKLKATFGEIPNSPEQFIQGNVDRNVAEAIGLNNSIYDYTQRIDRIGEQIKSASHAVSPGGAQKLTAESLGVMLNVLNESLRTQATALKMTAQNAAVANHQDKAQTREILDSSQSLTHAMKTESPTFTTLRF